MLPQDLIDQLVLPRERDCLPVRPEVRDGSRQVQAHFRGKLVRAFQHDELLALAVLPQYDAAETCFWAEVQLRAQGFKIRKRKQALRNRDDLLARQVHVPKLPQRVQMELDLVAVVPALRAGHDAAEGRIGDAAQARQLIRQNLEFELQLAGIRQVLVVAAAARAVVRARRSDALGGWPAHFHSAPAREVLVIFPNLDQNLFTGQGERDEDCAPIRQPAHAVAAVHAFFYQDSFVHVSIVPVRARAGRLADETSFGYAGQYNRSVAGLSSDGQVSALRFSGESARAGAKFFPRGKAAREAKKAPKTRSAGILRVSRLAHQTTLRAYQKESCLR